MSRRKADPEDILQTLEIAWRYTELGYPVMLFTRTPDGRKVPRIPKSDADGWGHAHKSATLNMDVFNAMVERYPDGRVAITADGIEAVILDFDPRNGGDRTLADLEASHGPLPPAPRQNTPSGGWHLVYKAPRDGRFTGKMGPGIDVKKRGWVGADPRVGYAWSEPLVQVEALVGLSPWAAEMITRPPEKTHAATVTADQISPAARLLSIHWPRPGGDEMLGFATAGRHEFAGAVAGYVLSRGLSLANTRALVEAAAAAAGDEELADRVRAVRDTHDKLRRGVPVTSTSVVGPVLGDQGLEELDQLLGLEWSPAAAFLIRHTDGEGRLLLARRREEWWRYAQGLWSAWPQEHIEDAVRRHLKLLAHDLEDAPKATRNTVAETLCDLRAIDGVRLPDEPEAPFWIDGRPISNSVVVSNGILNVETLELVPHDAGLFCTSALPVAWDPDATMPEGDKFLASVWPDEPQSIATLMEYGSIMLTGDMSHHKALMLIGATRAGKGTIIRWFQALLGRGSYVSTDIRSFGRNFGLQNVLGKKLVVFPDERDAGTDNLPSHSEIAATVDRILKWIGGDGLQVDRKYRDPIDDVRSIPTIWASNVLPTLKDLTHATTSRMLVLNFTRSFRDAPDTRLDEKLSAELPGLLVRLVLAWHDLRERGRFVQPGSGVEILDTLRELGGGPAVGTIRDLCIEEEGGTIGRELLRKLHIAWCRLRDVSPVHPHHWHAQLRAIVPSIKVDETCRPRVWRGLRLKTKIEMVDAELDDVLIKTALGLTNVVG